ncbi:MAG: GNAT family N-acetyltransferase [Actinomycetales bacterium]|nr:GNAT family N-acetyltransferase [Candidatus Phosphoribacter baldrii]MBK6956470.1 GNAT family N-acetyltransferase [Candidatus Phosphoribacter baldrii]MBK7610096.1 GNAT family N-acetyltransferase [Candidatus Phosphoribacter baldrii]HRC12478.1 GNAT family N-acetyltransferase [Dermatophilaceae bacterium]
MLRTHTSARALTPADRDEALALCARDPAANCFVAGRIEEGALHSMPGALIGVPGEDGSLRALAWASANLVPVECDRGAVDAIAHKVRRWRRQCASIFGPIDPVAGLWERLGPTWGPARTIRREQLLMSTAVDPGDWGLTIDERVRPARVDEVDLVLPASAAMFTEEIGYPPFIGSSTNYRSVVAGLVRLGRTFVWVEGGRVLFKADVGSVGVDAAQIQGVWLAPHLRGRGLATPLMAAVTSAILQGIASEATLYVNDFNIAAIATYEAIGFRRVGTFATILL